MRIKKIDLDATRRGTTTWVALAALLIASVMIGGIVLYALGDFFPGLGSGASLLTTIIIIVLFILFVIVRQRRVREIESEPDQSAVSVNTLRHFSS